PGIFPNQKFPAADGLGEPAIERALFNFFVHQSDADEGSHDEADNRDGGETQIDDHQALDADGYLADQDGSAEHHQREENQVVEYAVANRLAKRIHRDDSRNGDPRRAHRASTSTACDAAFWRSTSPKK